MIEVSRFDGSCFYLNAELIQSVEEAPDTIITLTNKEKIIVRERGADIYRKVVDYQRLVKGVRTFKLRRTLVRDEPDP